MVQETLWIKKALLQIDDEGVTKGCFSLRFAWYNFSVSVGIKNSVLPLVLSWLFMQSTFKKSASILKLDLLSDSFSSMVQERMTVPLGKDARLFILTWLIDKVLLNVFTKARN